MPVLEFMTDLSSEPVLNIPHDIAVQLPKAGRVRIIVVQEGDADGLTISEFDHSTSTQPVVRYTNAQLKQLALANPPPRDWYDTPEERPF